MWCSMRETFSLSNLGHSRRECLDAHLRRLGRVCLLLACTVGFFGIASCGDIPGAGRVVATVNGKPITYGALMKELERSKGPTVLLAMMDQLLIEAEAAKRKIVLSPQERDAGLDNAAARVGSMNDLKTRLQEAGIPLEAYRRDIETSILLGKIALQDVKVTDKDISDYYAKNESEFQRGPRVMARMMLFRDKGSAETILAALKEPGADFAGLAQNLSEDDATKGAGGDMGFFQKSDYAPAISDVAFKLKPGETSGIIKAPDGWVILRVEGAKPAGPLALDEVREQIRQRLIRDKEPSVRDQWLLQARKTAGLKVSDQELQKAVQAGMGQIKQPPMPGEL